MNCEVCEDKGYYLWEGDKHKCHKCGPGAAYLKNRLLKIIIHYEDSGYAGRVQPFEGFTGGAVAYTHKMVQLNIKNIVRELRAALEDSENI